MDVNENLKIHLFQCLKDNFLRYRQKNCKNDRIGADADCGLDIFGAASDYRSSGSYPRSQQFGIFSENKRNFGKILLLMTNF